MQINIQSLEQSYVTLKVCFSQWLTQHTAPLHLPAPGSLSA